MKSSSVPDSLPFAPAPAAAVDSRWWQWSARVCAKALRDFISPTRVINIARAVLAKLQRSVARSTVHHQGLDAVNSLFPLVEHLLEIVFPLLHEHKTQPKT